MYQYISAVVRGILRAYQVIMFADAIISWIPDLHGSKIHVFLNALVEPVLAPVRRLLFRVQGQSAIPIDLSFIIVYLIISVIVHII